MNGNSKRLRWRYQILFIAMLLFIVLGPMLASWQGDTRVFGRIASSIVLFAAVMTVVGRGRILPTVAVFAGVTLAFDWASLFLNQSAPDVAQHVVRGLFLFTLAVLILAYVFSSGPVNEDRIFAALCVYVLLGLLWAELYTVIEVVQPGAFDFPDIGGVMAQGVERLESDLVFYSFVTLTTLGYGDITPVAPMARTLSFLEAALGQMYLAVLVARLVGLHIAGARPADQG